MVLMAYFLVFCGAFFFFTLNSDKADNPRASAWIGGFSFAVAFVFAVAICVELAKVP